MRRLDVVVDVPMSQLGSVMMMTVRGRPGMWLNSSHSLPPLFEESSIMQDSKSYMFERVGPNPLHHDLRQYQVHDVQNPRFATTNLDKLSFPFLHTMIITDRWRLYSTS